MIDLCAGCGRPMPCCSRAYWSRHAPLARDQWYPTPRAHGWYLYGWALPEVIAPWKWTPNSAGGS